MQKRFQKSFMSFWKICNYFLQVSDTLILFFHIFFHGLFSVIALPLEFTLLFKIDQISIIVSEVKCNDFLSFTTSSISIKSEKHDREHNNCEAYWGIAFSGSIFLQHNMELWLTFYITLRKVERFHEKKNITIFFPFSDATLNRLCSFHAWCQVY